VSSPLITARHGSVTAALPQGSLRDRLQVRRLVDNNNFEDEEEEAADYIEEEEGVDGRQGLPGSSRGVTITGNLDDLALLLLGTPAGFFPYDLLE